MIAYVGGFRFPDGDAAAARVLGISRALRDCGYEVVFGGGEAKERNEDRSSGGQFSFEGFEYHSQDELDSRNRGGFSRLLHYLGVGKRTVEWLKRETGRRLDAVILYNGLTACHQRVSRFCRERGVPLVVDCTEWYSPFQCVGGAFGLHRWDVELTMRCWNVRAGFVLAISEFLKSYYHDKGCKALRVPPLVDLDSPKWQFPQKNPGRGVLQLVYAGNPGHKDSLIGILRGLAQLHGRGVRAHLEIIGPSAELVDRLCKEGGISDSTMRAIVHCSGRIAQNKVPSRLAEADFGVLQRPAARYAQAGFSTKLVEYLAAGVPVLVNRTSDISEYIRDGQEGFLLDDESENAFIVGVKRAIQCGPEHLREMRHAAKEQARRCFDYRQYTTILGSYFSRVIESRAVKAAYVRK